MRERRVRSGKPASTWISCVKKQLSEINISWEEAKLSRREGYKQSCISGSEHYLSCISERGIETVVYLGEREINSRASRGEGYKLSRIPERGI